MLAPSRSMIKGSVYQINSKPILPAIVTGLYEKLSGERLDSL